MNKRCYLLIFAVHDTPLVYILPIEMEAGSGRLFMGIEISTQQVFRNVFFSRVW